MSEKTSPKEECKNGKPKQTIGAAREEAPLTGLALRQIANNPEASQELKARSSSLASELASPASATDLARREALLLQATLLMAQGAA